MLNHEVSWLSLDTSCGHSELHRRVLTDPFEPCLRREARARRKHLTSSLNEGLMV
jgi:hypothetical protein